MSHEDMWRKNIPEIENTRCKGPEVCAQVSQMAKWER